jgi:RNA polymerase sigma-70 factor (ECF subfamily)
MHGPELPDSLREQTQAAWQAYLDILIPFRPDLYRYCRSLTGNPWDAEDLVQDTLVRAFGALGSIHHKVENARGYLVRIATNLWIDQTRRWQTERSVLAQQTPLEPSSPPIADARAAGATLFMLPAQERAAVLLKDVLDMSLREIAEILSTTEGAVKAALHRGREKLREPSRTEPQNQPSPELIDRFIDRLNAADLSGLLALMSDTAVIRMPGALVERGRDEFSRKGGWLWQAVHVHPDLPPEMRPPKWINERAIVLGQPVMLSFMLAPDSSQWLQSVATFEEEHNAIASICAYVFSPEVVREIAAELRLTAGVVFYQLPAEIRSGGAQ